ncbi:MAG TPA: cysteine desulfurase family protein [Candidatus Acidoferrales bacterium]|nr:cysteine desulfurase family protein [Candidatus Acidoferrales bacterium]
MRTVQRFYFDHNATTPIAPEVLETMVSCLGQVYGNASSIHHFGQNAKQRLEAARRQLAALINAAPQEIVFTAGGTEADNMAVLGATRAAERERRHVITCAIEHPAVLSPCKQLMAEGIEVTSVRVPPSGVVNPDDVRRGLRPETVLISIMHANNELGTVQPVAEIAQIAHQAGVPLHVDGVQALGKIPVDVNALGVDLYSMSGHKLYAPKGVGALYVRRGTRMAPVSFGGHHERDRRPGTENVPGIAAFGAAAELAGSRLQAESERLAALRDRLENAVLDRIPGSGVNGSRWNRVPNTSNLYFDGIDGEALVIALDLRGFAVSTGAACSSGALTPSHVLKAIGLADDRARSSMRFSLGRSNTAEQVDALVEAIQAGVTHLRRISVHA